MVAAAAAVLAVPATACATPSVVEAEQLAGGAAAALIGHPVELRCVGVDEFDATAGERPGQQWAFGIAGLTAFRAGVPVFVELTTATCANLARLHVGYPRRDRPTLGQSLAAFTLAHELGHVLGGPDEAAADRYGLAHAAAVAWWLGLRGRQRFVQLADWVRSYAPLHAGVAP